jgi:hypothetical protein
LANLQLLCRWHHRLKHLKPSSADFRHSTVLEQRSCPHLTPMRC